LISFLNLGSVWYNEKKDKGKKLQKSINKLGLTLI
jgi:hypothetical protein